MEKGARAERDKRAAILTAEGQRQSQILSASGERESLILRAQGERESQVLRAQADRQAKMLRAEGEAQAITTVFNAIHAGKPDQALLSYQYMQMLPSIARGDANKVWIVPSELNEALKGLGKAAGDLAAQNFGVADGDFTPPPRVDVFAEIAAQKAEAEAESSRTVKNAILEAQALEGAGLGPRRGHRASASPAIASSPESAVPEVSAAPEASPGPEQLPPA